MEKPVSLRLDSRIKKALENLAREEFTSVSSLLKKGAVRILQEHGIDWRKEDDE